MSKSPIELLFGAMFRGPSFVDPRSSAKQFAGRSTINSGSATVVVSTAAVKSDSLLYIGLEGNASRKILSGVLNINSGSVAATLSNAAVANDSVVLLTARQNGVAQNSGTTYRSVVVQSLANGWFSAGYDDGAAASPARLTPVQYVVYPAEGPPADVEVKTLADGAYFTLGYADGRATSRDQKVLWQITNTSHH